MDGDAENGHSVTLFILLVRFARYNPNVGMKKRRPGRPRTIPDGAAPRYNYKAQPSPSLMMLTEALAKLNNKPNGVTAKYTVQSIVIFSSSDSR